MQMKNENENVCPQAFARITIELRNSDIFNYDISLSVVMTS